jgi:hypothetical protein
MAGLFWSMINADDPLGDGLPSGDHLINAPVVDPPPRAVEDMRGVDERVDQLLIVCAAMWELVRERTGLTENDLVNKIAEIDARDGTADGKITPKPRHCPKCQRVIFPKHRRCLYCGCEAPVDSVFGTV